MNRTSSVLLEFNRELNNLGESKELRQGLSAVVQIGDTLWVANDETISLERLSRRKDDSNDVYRYSDHKQFPLNEYLQLPVLPSNSNDIEEADIEGLDYKDDYLWLVGSHSLKRSKPKKGDSIENNLKRLAKVSKDGNRFLLARIPVVKKDGMYSLEKEIQQGDKKLTAAQLGGNDEGNHLTEALAQDKHLRSFLTVPGKDNGFDIEGLAIAGKRLFIGLRGPVLRGWAVILEVELKEDKKDPFTLELNQIGPDNRPYRKHFLHLDGLGIRDLCVQERDLLILAGPTMELDGPVMLFRWQGGVELSGESLVYLSQKNSAQNIPFGYGKDKGKDHAEGMTLFSQNGDAPRSVLMVYDSPSDNRLTQISTVEADIFPLPT
ncbi:MULTISPECIES: DUF3616 domain-containing protein [Nostoc]|uniref:DUF3616 domain-containing protein n=2 Tax=Nostoc TaxID=1177 RepID=A0ABR8ILT7_9NOSO|nr:MULTISPECIES: DUF3616 domain-containing protein [Nostoc]MBD2564836.1 DUF3616 domain-containing protein [Nostoc linckia FACHB-391]MBD2651465.1 DUF3616 domain-containing protein [Nostoc foliaceum FACHB-393]